MGSKKITATQITASKVHDRPDEPCQGCGADVDKYVPNPDEPGQLIGGHCALCGRVWLPRIDFGPPVEVELDIEVEEHPDGSATVRFEEGS